MYKVIGIDEAGKGPVIGSMFIGFAVINLEKKEDLESYQKHLKELGVRDSKLIAPKKRNEIFETIKNEMDIKYAQLTPSLIDNNFFGGGKLNELEIRSIIHVLEQEKPQLFIIDALTADPKKFGNSIKKRLSFECDFVSENKADSKYEIVGAASIIAKELREKEIKEIKEKIGIDCGSGYPADPKTKKFLQENFQSKEFDFIFRKSWKTYQKHVKSKFQKTLDEF